MQCISQLPTQPNPVEAGPIAMLDDHSDAEIDRYFRAAVALRGTQLSMSVDPLTNRLASKLTVIVN